MQSIYQISEIVLYVNDKAVVIVIRMTEWNLRRKKKVTKRFKRNIYQCMLNTHNPRYQSLDSTILQGKKNS